MSQTTNNNDENMYAWAHRPVDDSSATNQGTAAPASAPAGPTHQMQQAQPGTGQEHRSPEPQAPTASGSATAAPEPQPGTQQQPGTPQPGYGQASYGQQPQYGQPQPQYGQAPQAGQPQYGQPNPAAATQANPQSGAYGQAPDHQVPAEQTTWHSPYARPQQAQAGYDPAAAQTLTAYPTNGSAPSSAPEGTAAETGTTGPVPAAGFGAGGMPPTGKKRKSLGQPGWRGVIAVGLGAALIASLLSVGAVLATQDDTTTTSALASTSQSSDSEVEAPVTDSTSQNPDWTAVAAAVSPSVVAVQVTSQTSEGEGSGVILDTDGRIVTNYHVVNGVGSNATIEVVLNDGRKYSASVVGSDSTTDLAVIQLEDPPDDLTAITMGSTDSVSVGDSVMAVGNPLGLAGTVTTGIVSALDRPVTTTQTSTDESSQQGMGSSSSADSEEVVTNAIQTDAAVNPGNSGGALVNAQGELIGINSSIAALSSSSAYGESSSESGSIGLGFAIPVDEVKSVANQLIEDGTAEHSWLGVSVTDTSVTVDGAERDGALLSDIVSDSPADDAELEADDVVIAVDGDYINGAESLVAQLRERTPGTEVTLTIVRDGSSKDVTVTLGTRPDSAS